MPQRPIAPPLVELLTGYCSCRHNESCDGYGQPCLLCYSCSSLGLRGTSHPCFGPSSIIMRTLSGARRVTIVRRNCTRCAVRSSSGRWRNLVRGRHSRASDDTSSLANGWTVVQANGRLSRILIRARRVPSNYIRSSLRIFASRLEVTWKCCCWRSREEAVGGRRENFFCSEQHRVRCASHEQLDNVGSSPNPRNSFHYTYIAHGLHNQAVQFRWADKQTRGWEFRHTGP